MNFLQRVEHMEFFVGNVREIFVSKKVAAQWRNETRAACRIPLDAGVQMDRDVGMSSS